MKQDKKRKSVQYGPEIILNNYYNYPIDVFVLRVSLVGEYDGPTQKTQIMAPVQSVLFDTQRRRFILCCSVQRK